MTKKQMISTLLEQQPCTDAVSRQDAIEAVKQAIYNHDSAIMRLTELPSVNPQPCEDAISREAVNALYDKWRPRLATHVSEFGDELKSLPSVQPKPIECDDAISREAVIYYIKGHIHEIITESGTDKNAHTNSILRALINGVETMPSVTHKSGKWIEETKRECVFSIKGEDYECREYGNEIYLHCSNCGWKTGSQANDFNYCPNCGCRMVDPQESKDKERIKAIPSAEPNMTWVTGADDAKIALKDVPVWKAIKICEILGEPQESEDKEMPWYLSIFNTELLKQKGHWITDDVWRDIAYNTEFLEFLYNHINPNDMEHYRQMFEMKDAVAVNGAEKESSDADSN